MITDVAKIGPRFRELRAAAGMTQSEVAQACGLHQNTLSVFEKSGEGSLVSLFALVDFYQKKLNPRAFDLLADNFAITEAPGTPLAAIAAERLDAFKRESAAQLDEIITQLKGPGLQQL